jgi:hypothetical protein
VKIHTDKLTRADLYAHVPAGCYLEAIEKGSRSRAHAFDVHMNAEPGDDRHGIKRIYQVNSGNYGAGGDEYVKAATYVEWGDWMVELFKIDPNAVVGVYDGAAGFVSRTSEMAPHRPSRENAERHAERWAKELNV